MIDEEVDSSNPHGEAFRAKPVYGKSSVGFNSNEHRSFETMSIIGDGPLGKHE